MVCYGMLWYVIVCYSMLWYVMVCYGMLWYVMVFDPCQLCSLFLFKIQYVVSLVVEVSKRANVRSSKIRRLSCNFLSLTFFVGLAHFCAVRRLGDCRVISYFFGFYVGRFLNLSDRQN